MGGGCGGFVAMCSRGGVSWPSAGALSVLFAGAFGAGGICWE